MFSVSCTLVSTVKARSASKEVIFCLLSEQRVKPEKRRTILEKVSGVGKGPPRKVLCASPHFFPGAVPKHQFLPWVSKSIFRLGSGGDSRVEPETHGSLESTTAS